MNWHFDTTGHVANLKDKGVIYNLSDKNDTTQGKMNEMLEDILNIKTESTNSLLAGIAKVRSDLFFTLTQSRDVVKLYYPKRMYWLVPYKY